MSRVLFFDVKEDDLWVYLMTKRGNSFRLQERIRMPAGGEEQFAIRKKLEAKDIRDSFLSLPLSMLNFRIIRLPFSDRERIREVLPFELDGLIIGGREGVVFDSCILGESNGKSDILAIFVREGVLKEVLDKLRAWKVDPRIVTSIELGSAISSYSNGKEILDLLLNPEPIGDEDRVNIATREVNNPTINLRGGRLCFTGDSEKIRKGLRLTFVLVLLLLMAFLSHMMVRIVHSKREITSIRAEMRKTYLAVFPQDRKITDELYQMKAHLKELKEKERSYIGINPLQLFHDLALIGKPGFSLREVTIDQERILLKGECQSLTDLQQIKSKLEGLLSDVDISDAKTPSANRVLFTITAKGRKA